MPNRKDKKESAPEQKKEQVSVPRNTGRFLPDESPVGTWESIDFVARIEDFVPGRKSWRGDLFLKEKTFHVNGKIDSNMTWGKGYVWYPGFQRKGNYWIKEIGGSKYMFVEWISGDVTIRGMKPKLYVLKKLGGAEQVSGRILPNENPVGSWATVDFVRDIEYFSPGRKKWRGKFSFKNLSFYGNGKTSSDLFTWGKGYLWFTRFQRNGNYLIKEINGSKYLFMEWISGDVTIRGMKPGHYVLKKMN